MPTGGTWRHRPPGICRPVVVGCEIAALTKNDNRRRIDAPSPKALNLRTTRKNYSCNLMCSESARLEFKKALKAYRIGLLLIGNRAWDINLADAKIRVPTPVYGTESANQ
jgi:hypothetical protein